MTSLECKPASVRGARLMLIGVACAIASLAMSAFAAEPDCPHCPAMVAVPAGEFTMGAAPGEEEREQLGAEFRGRSEPRRKVQVRSFAAGRFEVTRGEFRAFANATGHKSDGCFVWKGGRFDFDAAHDWRNPGYPQDDRHPVSCVSWDDATEYVKWLSQQTGRRYRLLSEAEWEYAARAGTNAARHWGDDAALSCRYANGGDMSTAAALPEAAQWSTAPCNDGHPYTAPVGSFPANRFGLHDMIGNVEEWTQDCWNPNYVGAPAAATARSTGDCSMRAVRGGSWDDAQVGLRAAYRVGSPTSVRVFRRGFRVARDL